MNTGVPAGAESSVESNMVKHYPKGCWDKLGLVCALQNVRGRPTESESRLHSHEINQPSNHHEQMVQTISKWVVDCCFTHMNGPFAIYMADTLPKESGRLQAIFLVNMVW